MRCIHENTHCFRCALYTPTFTCDTHAKHKHKHTNSYKTHKNTPTHTKHTQKHNNTYKKHTNTHKNNNTYKKHTQTHTQTNQHIQNTHTHKDTNTYTFWVWEPLIIAASCLRMMRSSLLKLLSDLEKCTFTGFDEALLLAGSLWWWWWWWWWWW